MAMTGGGDHLTNEINVTPMIDVLLVLLIIFMMVIPMSRKALDLQLPDPTPDDTNSGPPPSQIVLEVLPGNTFKINSQPVAKAELAKRITACTSSDAMTPFQSRSFRRGIWSRGS